MKPRRGRTAALLAVAIVSIGLPLGASPAGAAARDVADACPGGLVPASDFTDTEGLPEGIVLAIDCILAWAVTQGTSAETFAPAAPVSRGQMATFLVNALGVTTGWEAPESPDNAFTDDEGTTHEANINILAAEGIAKGTGPESFSPAAQVTRGQMATFVVATLRAVLSSVSAPSKDHFTDDNGTTHETSINTLADLGIVTGTASDGYEPGAPVLRRQMALFLARSLDLLVEDGKAALPFPEVLVEGDPETLPFRATRECAVGSRVGEKVQLALLPPENVTEAEDGTLTFADLNEDGRADRPAVVADIVAVEGSTKASDTKTVDDVTSDGEISVTLGAADEGDAVLVAFIDRAATAHALDLKIAGTPAEPAAVGCRTSWIPPEAVFGNHTDVVVNAVNVEAEVPYFTGATTGGSAATFYYDADDLYEGEATDMSAFGALLSTGDVVSVDYATDPADVSTFTVTTDTVQAPGEPVVTAKNLDEGSTRNDLEVAFPVPAHNGAGTEYRVERLATLLIDGACSEEPEGGSGFISVGTTPQSPFVDPNVAAGCYQYRVWSVSPTGTTKTSIVSAPVESGLPDESEKVRPTSEVAKVTDAAPTGLSSGDKIEILFSEEMDEPDPGDSITISDGAVSVTLSNGPDAAFGLNSSDTTIGTVAAPHGHLLTITVGTTPSPTVGWSTATTVITHQGVTDPAGNTWDVAGSDDTTLEVAP